MTAGPTHVRRITVSTGPDGLVNADLGVALRPDHPGGHGSLRLRLTVDDERIRTAEPVLGLLHRGAEKLFEVRDYRQVLALANRHDWLGAFASELGVCLVVEEALGLPVPERATWIRMLVAELTRVASHLAFLHAFPVEVSEQPAASPNPLREAILDLFEEVCGARMHLTLCRLGGLRTDLPAGWTGRARHTIATVRAGLAALLAPVQQPAVRERCTGVGVVTTEAIHAYGLSGPVARASGLDMDLRRDVPYLAYAELFAPGGPGRVVTRVEGDAAARVAVLAEQVEVSLDLADSCLDRLAALPQGPVASRLPKVVRVPEGEWYAATESPLGMAGCYLVSTGATTPWRVKLRTPSFATVAALAEVLPGTRLSDLVTVLASMPFVVGDVER